VVAMSANTCPSCGRENSPDATVCAHCGTPIQSAPPQAAGLQKDLFTLKPGQVVANRYRVLGLVGRGGMGAIYRVHDDVLKEQVALKTLLPQFAQDKTVVERFYNEARIARQLSHPNIVRVHDIGMAGPVMYISMEYLDGRSLRTYLEERDPQKALTLRQKLMIVDQICAALEYAHRYTVHRDIKPENIMITSDGTVKLMDFGISKLVAHTRLTMTSIVMGTPQYMSPEQFRDSGAVDARADIYSLGVLLYELFTGELPTAVAAPLSEQAPDVPKAMDAIVAKCLAADPKNRYQTAHELRAAIREVIKSLDAANEQGVAAEPVVKRAAPTTKKNIGKVLAIVVIVAVGSFLVWRLGILTSVRSDSRSPLAEENPASYALHIDDLLAKAHEKAREAARTSQECRNVLALGEDFLRQADTEAVDSVQRRALFVSALQCFAGVILWAADPSFCFIPPGEVVLQDSAGNPKSVRLSGFFISRTLVTNRDFLDFVRNVSGGWVAPAYLAQGNLDDTLLSKPVVGIPYYSALAYASWKHAKLPTEAQWTRVFIASKEHFDVQAPENGIREWTRTVYSQDPYLSATNSDAATEPFFGTNMTVCGMAPSGTGRIRLPVAFEAGPGDVSFRIVFEIPDTVEQLASIF